MRERQGHDHDRAEELTVVVISGAVARGAYEAGALAAVLPAIAPRGLGQTVLIGTSAGAINAALWAQHGVRGADLSEVGERVLDVWRSIDERAVFAPLPSTLVRFGALFGASMFGWSEGAAGLLDTSPLHQTAARVLDEATIERNVAQGAVRGVGAVATLCPGDGSGGRSRVFVRTELPLPRDEHDGALDYVDTPLLREHVLASSGVPGLFPPVEVTQPARAAGWYIDGGVRLNTPIKPAIALGATRLVVISSHATRYPVAPSQPAGRPSIEDTLAQSLHSVLGDGMIEDLRNLRRLNRAAHHMHSHGAPPLRNTHGHAYRVVPHLLVAPSNGEMAALAREVFDGKYQKRGFLRGSLDYRLIDLLLSGGGRSLGDNELLSYLFFDPDYFEAQFALGRAHGERALEEGWCIGDQEPEDQALRAAV